MKCPRCASHRVYRSQRSDRLIWRLLLCVKLRCHSCSHKFMASLWSTLGQPIEPPQVAEKHAA